MARHSAPDSNLVSDAIATAPGDLPIRYVEERFAAQRSQFRHDNTISPLAPRPSEPVDIWATSGSEIPLDGARVWYSTDGGVPASSSPQVAMEIAAVDWDVRTGYLTRWRAALPAQPAGTVVRYRIGGIPAGQSDSQDEPAIWANDGQGFWFRFPGERGITTFAYRVEPPGPPLPAWLEGATVYQIFLDRFHPRAPDGAWRHRAGPTERHGGTLAGVRLALPYLAELGVGCLWLSPLLPSETYHRYDGTDYFNVDPALGTNEDLRALSDEAHARGMRILLDFVPSHVSWRHPAFVAAQRDRDAATVSWFTFDRWPDDYRCFLERARTLPSLNTDDPGARAYLIESAVHWVRDVGIGGFRLDHAIGPSMDFWVAFRAALERTRPDVATIGEATDTPDSLRRYRNRLHGVLDFPLAGALRRTFATGDWGVAQLSAFLDAYERFMAEGPGRVSFLDNHDMDRFLYLAGGSASRLKLGALCQFTLSATPTIYYGTEIALSQRHGIKEIGHGGDAEARRDMPWDPGDWDGDLLAFYRTLIRLRRELPALKGGTRRTVHLEARAGTFAYLRESTERAGRVLAAFNLGTEARRIPLPEGDWRALLTTGEVASVEGGRLSLPAGCGALLGDSARF
ncbi:MAG: DUF3459 domain-containing protein [Chloroflexi bacterium]|nr:DUF3459 domain-containing protein [Chloroflexota bacterium]